MKQKQLGAVATWITVGACALPALGQTQPNLVFILADDFGVESIAGPYWGNEMGCITPTLDALAQQGVSFTNCRVNPNCSPTRACLMTGRYALDTGVNGVLGRYAGTNACEGELLSGTVADVTDCLSLQNDERTIAEVLHDKGYYTVLVDKWHCGYNQGSDRGLLPQQQGFDKFIDWLGGDPRFICEDDPLEIHDEHMLAIKDAALNLINNREQQYEGKPYALFFHTITPHGRHGDEDPNYPNGDGYHWWRVDPELCPQSWYEYGQTYDVGEPDDGGNVIRFIQNVEALDTALTYLLSNNNGDPNLNGLEVINPQSLEYDGDSHTIVFFTGDNGTDGRVSSWGPNGAKNSLYEGGVHVPLFVMGESISGTGLADTADDRMVGGVDVYDTICDIVEATETERGDFPRRSMSFADSIGWHEDPLPQREFTLCSLGNADTGDQVWRVALIWDHYKLICNADSNVGDDPPVAGFDDLLNDQFIDLLEYPEGEPYNLLNGAMSVDEVTTYFYMRDRLVDYWSSAVSTDAFNVPEEYTVEHFPDGLEHVLVAHIVFDNGSYEYDSEEFYDLGVDPGRLNNLVGEYMTSEQLAAYNALHAGLVQDFNDGFAAPDVRVLDIP